VYSPLSERQPSERDNVAIAKAYGVSGSRGDGNNIQTVYELAQKAVNHVRTHQGPYFLELETYRWREHCGPNFDNDLGYRSENEYQEWKQRCPVENFEKLLLDTKIIEKSQVEQMRKTILREFEEAVDFAKSSPFPDSGEIGKNLYKEKDLNPI
jgi:pyruvate dehydrogenase E1 component alpha subunit